jgi:hypothetical protein
MDSPDTVPDSLSVGGLRLPLQRTPTGVMLAADDARTEPLVFVINAALDGVLEGLQAHLKDGTSMAIGGLFALRLRDLDDPPPDEAAQQWTELTGMPTGPPEEAYLVGAEFLPSPLLVPGQILGRLLDDLQSIRSGRLGASADPTGTGDPID